MRNKFFPYNLLLIVVMILLLGLSVFKNIGHPLMWGDEAETALFARRIIEYGYPKVHSGNNSLNLSMVSGEGVGVREEFDALTVTVWGQYYYAAIGEYFAGQVEDMFLKTAILRTPFALMGIAGILILPFVGIFAFGKDKEEKDVFYILYIFLQILSISLLLHIREVRSYSMSIFFSSLSTLIFVRYYFRRDIHKLLYVFLLLVSLTLLMSSFLPGYFAMMVSLGGYVIYEAISKRTFDKEVAIMLLPLLLSGLITIPVYAFFQISEISSNAYLDMNYGIRIYFEYMSRIVEFLLKYHFLLVAIYLKVQNYLLNKKVQSFDEEQNINIDNRIFLPMEISHFLTFMLLCNVVTTPLTPFLFDRYFVFTQPLLSLIILIDIYVGSKLIKMISKKNIRSEMAFSYVFLVLFFFGLSLVTKVDVIRGHVYELTHVYRGPMDEVIEYIADNYQKPEDLTIYTNIENTPLIYYLGSSVICDDRTDCYKDPPDIFIPRRYLQAEIHQERFERYLAQANYTKKMLPILDYPVNNIPELSMSLRHLFKSPFTDNDDMKIVLFVKDQ